MPITPKTGSLFHAYPQVANVGIAGYIFTRNEIWWLAGVAGVVVGSVWNYAVSSVFMWKQK
jgi:dolichol-phosphate mannosyltransferase